MKLLQRLSPSLLLCLVFLVPAVSSADGSIIPLPADVAKDLELLGKGVVEEPISAPPMEDLVEWYMGSASGGEWTYEVVKGKKKHLRVETIKPAKARNGHKAWSQQIGDQYVQHMQQHVDGGLGKYGEDDLALSYGCHFHPGLALAPGLKPGKTIEVKQKVLAYKSGHPDKTAYTGDMDIKLTYVGAYEVKTPAGIFPAALIRSEFDIKIGPAKVKDVQYSFFAKGVGKVAEIEALKVSALLVYNDNEKTAKVLTKKPAHAN